MRSHNIMIVSYFFFFQAEDGIRDYKVTGVQTCALPISCASGNTCTRSLPESGRERNPAIPWALARCGRDRKSTRLNSSHLVISYAVFCLKKKKKTTHHNGKLLATNQLIHQ